MKMEPMGKSEEAFKIYQELVNVIKLENYSYLAQGKLLKRIRDEQWYLHLGEGGFDTFLQFINNAEIGMKQAKAYSLISIYEFFIEKLGIPEEQILEHKYTRLHEILPKLKQLPTDEAKEKFEQSGSLTNYDYSEFKRENNLPKKPYSYLDKEKNKWHIVIDSQTIADIEIDGVMYDNTLKPL